MTQTQVDTAITFALTLHQAYDTFWWQKPSFHNEWHVKVNQQASALLFKAALKGQDPCLLLPSLTQWNQKQKTTLTLDEAADIFQLAFAWHDTGNILAYPQTSLTPAKISLTQIIKKVIPPEPERQIFQLLVQQEVYFLNHYTAKDAAKRSQFLIDLVLPHLSMSQEKQVLLKYLINQSTWMYQSINDPFAFAWRVIDYCASGLWEPSQKKLEYLILTEWIAEDPKRLINLDYDMSFNRNRLAELCNHNQALVQAILKIFQKNLPKVESHPGGTQLSISQVLAWLEKDPKINQLKFEQVYTQ